MCLCPVNGNPPYLAFTHVLQAGYRAMLARPRHTLAVSYAHTGEIDGAALEKRWGPALSAHENARLRSLRLERDRRDYLAAHVLLRLTLASERGLEPETVDPRERAGWSITHTGGFVACAVTSDPHGRVGVDVEHISAAQRLEELTGTFLTATEHEALPGDPDARAVRMVEVWTAKEALLKALGEGFSGEMGFGVLSMLESTPLGKVDGWGTISVRDARNGAAYSVWRRWVGLHSLAIVAIEGHEGEPRLMGVLLQ